MAKLYEIAVLGATPAGYAAAHRLARKKHDVVVIDAPCHQSESPLCDWVPADFFRLTGLPPGLANSCNTEDFKKVLYHNAALDRRVQWSSRKLAGRFLNSEQLCTAMAKAANKLGVRTRKFKSAPDLELKEDEIRIEGSTLVRAKLLVVVQSQPQEILAELALPTRGVPQPPLVVAALDVPVDAQRAQEADGGMHVIELPERSELGIFFVWNQTLHVRIISKSIASGTRAAELSSMINRLQVADILPLGIQLSRAQGAIWHPPAGIGLEMETHTAKRCILAGTAGGFAGAISGQTLRPCVHSALLAADAAAEALKSDDVQDHLMRFKTAWRRELGEYMRPPSTSLHMLLPLLFVNDNIVPRFTNALLFGESI